jgi:hypothetical protein
LVKFAWLYDFFRACIDAMARISEVSTTSAFMLPIKVDKKDNFLKYSNWNIIVIMNIS